MAGSTQQPVTTEPAKPEVRDQIAGRVLGWGSAAVAAVAIVAICCTEKSQVAQQIFTAVITLIGSWGGAVIAFYFSRENFEAASRHTEMALDRLTGDTWRSLKLKDVMIPIAKVESLSFAAAATEITVEQIQQKFQAIPFERLLFVDAGGAVRYVLHLSSLNSYLVRNPQAPASTATLQDLVDDSGIGRLLTDGFRVLRGDNTLADAKLMIDKNAECQDLVITEDGEAGSRAIGWLSNNTILEKSRA